MLGDLLTQRREDLKEHMVKNTCTCISQFGGDGKEKFMNTMKSFILG